MVENRRYELKLVFDRQRINELRARILAHPDVFGVAYPRRQVNNIYFDTQDFQFWTDHVAGSAVRAKLRFRWYGGSWAVNEGQLERKVKMGDAGYKLIKPIHASFDLSRHCWRDVIRIITQNITPDFEPMFGSLIPTVINLYQREYFVSRDGVVRVTLDYDMAVFEQTSRLTPNIRYQKPVQQAVILEMKVPVNEYQRASSAMAGFPLYRRQYSKYLDAMENLPG
ncbi:MAG: VTC domain-containing protein [Anaerolineales bacterium]|nr:VTC domain-containing protein [Anaerolineales bacterium]